MESKSAGELFELIKPLLRDFMLEMLSDHAAKSHALLSQDMSRLQSQVVQNEARVVICEEAQKKVYQEQQKLACIAQDAVDSLKQIEETIADEVGRAQEMAQKALDKAEHAKPIINNIKMPGGDQPIWGGEYDYGIKPSLFATGTPTLDEMVSNLQSPAKVLAVSPFSTFDDKVYTSLVSQVPYHPEECAKKIHNIISQKPGKVNKLAVHNNGMITRYVMDVEATSENRRVKLGYEPVPDQWSLLEIQELDLLGHCTVVTEESTKSKKKRSKKNANSISK